MMAEIYDPASPTGCESPQVSCDLMSIPLPMSTDNQDASIPPPPPPPPSTDNVDSVPLPPEEPKAGHKIKSDVSRLITNAEVSHKNKKRSHGMKHRETAVSTENRGTFLDSKSDRKTKISFSIKTKKFMQPKVSQNDVEPVIVEAPTVHIPDTVSLHTSRAIVKTPESAKPTVVSPPSQSLPTQSTDSTTPRRRKSRFDQPSETQPAITTPEKAKFVALGEPVLNTSDAKSGLGVVPETTAASVKNVDANQTKILPGPTDIFGASVSKDNVETPVSIDGIKQKSPVKNEPRTETSEIDSIPKSPITPPLAKAQVFPSKASKEHSPDRIKSSGRSTEATESKSTKSHRKSDKISEEIPTSPPGKNPSKVKTSERTTSKLSNLQRIVPQASTMSAKELKKTLQEELRQVEEELRAQESRKKRDKLKQQTGPSLYSDEDLELGDKDEDDAKGSSKDGEEVGSDDHKDSSQRHLARSRSTPEVTRKKRSRGSGDGTQDVVSTSEDLSADASGDRMKNRKDHELEKKEGSDVDGKRDRDVTSSHKSKQSVSREDDGRYERTSHSRDDDDKRSGDSRDGVHHRRRHDPEHDASVPRKEESSSKSRRRMREEFWKQAHDATEETWDSSHREGKGELWDHTQRGVKEELYERPYRDLNEGSRDRTHPEIEECYQDQTYRDTREEYGRGSYQDVDEPQGRAYDDSCDRDGKGETRERSYHETKREGRDECRRESRESGWDDSESRSWIMSPEEDSKSRRRHHSPVVDRQSDRHQDMIGQYDNQDQYSHRERPSRDGNVDRLVETKSNSHSRRKDSLDRFVDVDRSHDSSSKSLAQSSEHRSRERSPGRRSSSREKLYLDESFEKKDRSFEKRKSPDRHSRERSTERASTHHRSSNREDDVKTRGRRSRERSKDRSREERKSVERSAGRHRRSRERSHGRSKRSRERSRDRGRKSRDRRSRSRDKRSADRSRARRSRTRERRSTDRSRDRRSRSRERRSRERRSSERGRGRARISPERSRDRNRRSRERRSRSKGRRSRERRSKSRGRRSRSKEIRSRDRRSRERSREKDRHVSKSSGRGTERSKQGAERSTDNTNWGASERSKEKDRAEEVLFEERNILEERTDGNERSARRESSREGKHHKPMSEMKDSHNDSFQEDSFSSPQSLPAGNYPPGAKLDNIPLPPDSSSLLGEYVPPPPLPSVHALPPPPLPMDPQPPQPLLVDYSSPPPNFPSNQMPPFAGHPPLPLSLPPQMVPSFPPPPMRTFPLLPTPPPPHSAFPPQTITVDDMDDIENVDMDMDEIGQQDFLGPPSDENAIRPIISSERGDASQKVAFAMKTGAARRQEITKPLSVFNEEDKTKKLPFVDSGLFTDGGSRQIVDSSTHIVLATPTSTVSTPRSLMEVPTGSTSASAPVSPTRNTSTPTPDFPVPTCTVSTPNLENENARSVESFEVDSSQVRSSNLISLTPQEATKSEQLPSPDSLNTSPKPPCALPESKLESEPPKVTMEPAKEVEYFDKFKRHIWQQRSEESADDSKSSVDSPNSSSKNLSTPRRSRRIQSREEKRDKESEDTDKESVPAACDSSVADTDKKPSDNLDEKLFSPPFPVPADKSDTPSVRPEKVKSRWRRWSEIEASSSDPHSTVGEFSSPEPVKSEPSDTDTKQAAADSQVTASTTVSQCSATSVSAIMAMALKNTTQPEPDEEPPPYDRIVDNIYLQDRKKTKSQKEARRMVCDCVPPGPDEPATVGCGDDCLNRMLMIECGSRCPCADLCSNRNFQRHHYAPTEIFRTSWKGWGLRAAGLVKKGTFVMEYVGEVCGYTEFKSRSRRYARQHIQHYYFMALNSDEIIDATNKGNLSRFINHSCEPNCETQKWTVNGQLRVGFFTVQDIHKGEELTFNYQFEQYGEQAQKCFCGAESCRGTIGIVKQRLLADGGEEEEDLEEKEKKTASKKKLFDDVLLGEAVEKLELAGGGDGVRTKAQVLEVARLMVRAENTQHRTRLLQLLQSTKEVACLRLFLDYNGLSLLWSWMCDMQSSSHLAIKVQVLKTLQILPITNKTILTESKVLSLVERWTRELPTTTSAIYGQESDRSSQDRDSEASSTPRGNPDPPSEPSTPDSLPHKKRRLLQRLTEEASSSDGEMWEGKSGECGKEELTDECRALLDEYQMLLEQLLNSWSELKEMFKIPKKQVLERKRTEEELEPRKRTYDEQPDWLIKAREENKRRRTSASEEIEDRAFKTRRSGVLIRGGTTPSKLSKHERRQQFEARVRAEEEQKAREQQQSNPAMVDSLLGSNPAAMDVQPDSTQMNYFTDQNGTLVVMQPDGSVVPVDALNQNVLDPNALNPSVLDPNVLDPGSQQLVLQPSRGYPPPEVHSSQFMPLSGQHDTASHILQAVQAAQNTLLPQQPPLMPNTLSQPQPNTVLQNQPVRQPAPQNTMVPPQQQNQPQVVQAVPSQQLVQAVPSQQPTTQLVQMVQGQSTAKVVQAVQGQLYYSTTPQGTSASPSHLLIQQVPSFVQQPLQLTEFANQASSTTSQSSTKRDPREPPPPPPSPPAKPKPCLPPNWKMARDQDGKAYYYHSVTRQTQWEAPGWDTEDDSDNMDLGTPGDDDQRKRTTTAAADTSSENAKKIKDQFRSKIAKHIVTCLGPYRKPDCKLGRISTTDDFKHLARKITHAVLDKELKYCRHLEDLEVNENVKGKAKDYVKKYMSRFGSIYRKTNSP